MNCPDCYEPLVTERHEIATHRGTLVEHTAYCDHCGYDEECGVTARRAHREDREDYLEEIAGDRV